MEKAGMEEAAEMEEGRRRNHRAPCCSATYRGASCACIHSFFNKYPLLLMLALMTRPPTQAGRLKVLLRKVWASQRCLPSQRLLHWVSFPLACIRWLPTTTTPHPHPLTLYTGAFTREPRGLGFVEFSKAKDAEDAKYGMDGMVLSGREVSIPT